MQKIKKGDTVKILNGKDKGKTGEVIKVLPKKEKLIVKGINIITKFEKSNTQNKGGIIKVEGAINLSKVMLICPETGKPTRVKFVTDEKTGKKQRYSIKAKKVI